MRAARVRRIYAGAALVALVAGGGVALVKRMSSSCPDVAERLCAWDAAHCDELRSALARREEPDCSTALRGLDAADRLPAHLRPAMMAQVLADLTGQTGEVEALKEGLRGRGVGPDASARKP